ncbi:CAF17-like 4Fe-4S cluster assembly/insertion protein YgfZ [Pseudonocardia phyllosphaerae]|uniref:CAF17-like 4Fe-4S cluster assembly/insertion protein YgfZ n=1 Tax=Pseudonocardia phyllosphaerae TaxID=3390502 RepID=UPI00397E892F
MTTPAAQNPATPETDDAGPADPDAAVAAHHGDPPAEQRAMARAAAVVDRGHRDVLAVTGEERLAWLHLLLTQHMSELGDDTGTEALILDAQGRVLHHAAVAHTAGAVYLDTEAGDGAALLDYLTKMVFWSKVEPRDATAELTVLTVVGPDTPSVLESAGLPVPAAPHGVAPLSGGGFVRRTPWPGKDAADVVVPREEADRWWSTLTGAGARAAGSIAFEALRVESRAPRLHLDTDERTIPHEVGWIGPAVHLTKGCYRGQETVARVANLGRPPRRLVQLLLDAGDEDLPRTGDPVVRDGRTVGRVGTVVQHHELGPIALALVKRSVPADAELTAGDEDRVSPATIDPNSYEADSATPPPGRAARARAKGGPGAGS